jgi:hypothetical protein
MIKYKTFLSLPLQLALFLVWHHYDPIGADVMGIVLVIFVLGFVLRIYFWPIESKYESIAKFKTKHGIPLDQPHKVDEILKEGFFKAD